MNKPVVAPSLLRAVRAFDPALLLALALALVFSLYGIRWGRVECWNRDDMAMRGISGLRPGTYAKPPFHTYLNHVLVIWPLDAAEAVGTYLTGRKVNLNESKLLQSRFVVVGMFLATVALAYWISRRSFGRKAARIIALLFATSAGFIEYDHFLTCDSPLLLWMMLAFFFARRVALSGESISYVLAGFATGLATATKYNGLLVGITLPLAHLFANRGWKSILLSRRFALALLMVPLGFIAGAPAAPFQWRKFATDFFYNAAVTPHYGGQMGGHGYTQFLTFIPEILGWPGTIFAALAAIASLILLLRRRDFASPRAICFALAFSVELLNFVYIGSFPRMETRFVLPAIPFFILLAGPAFALAPRVPLTLLLTPLLIYNSICSLSVGYRFNRDPRLAAQIWIANRAAFPRKLLIESSSASPNWTKLPSVHGVTWGFGRHDKWRPASGNVVDLRLPTVNGRAELFARLFGADSLVGRHATDAEGAPDERLFTPAELLKRNPDVITIYSGDYEPPTSPRVRDYYMKLLNGDARYAVAFDGATKPPPFWVYPQVIDFLRGRITILERSPQPASAAAH